MFLEYRHGCPVINFYFTKQPFWAVFFTFAQISRKMVEAKEVIVYDLTLPQPQRKDNAMKFSSARKAARWLGMKKNNVPYFTNPEEQKRYFSEKHNKHFAIRWAK